MREGCGLVCWLLRGQRVEKTKEKDWDEEEDQFRGVVIGRLREQEEQQGEDGCEECEYFPSADFWGADHG
jgi:hypothetical protein